MKIPCRSLLATTACATLLCGCAPSAAVDPPATTPAATVAAATPVAGSLRLTIRLAAGGAQIVSRVATEEPLQRRDPYRNEPTFFRVFDAGGRVLAERGFRLETELRSEVPDADGALSGTRVPNAAPIVSLQIPRFAEMAAVRLYKRGATAGAAPELLAEVRP